MEPTVEAACKAVARQGVLPGDAMHTLYGRWRREAGARVADLSAFANWLAGNGSVTEYQAGVIGRGNADQLSLGDYVILERIAKGSMAGVYKARHRLGQVVAVKVLPPSRARDSGLLARFHRESRLALRLRHPNVVRTLQTGKHGALHYLVMEFLEGETLDEVLRRRGPIPPGEAARLVHQALLGLQHLHEQGLVHRDLKPGNLLIVGGRTDDTGDATVKVHDIGTGRALFDEHLTAGEAVGELTGEGDLLGTPAYMAPEQARDPRSADVRADVYSLGCVLYHTLAGRPPFVNSNRVRLLVQHATETPPPVTRFNPSVPEALAQVLDWMLAKDPARRYPTPERAALALQVFLVAGDRFQEPSGTREATMSSYLDWLAKNAVQIVGSPAVARADVELVGPEPPVPSPLPEQVIGRSTKPAAPPGRNPPPEFRKARIARGPADTEPIDRYTESGETPEASEDIPEVEEVDERAGMSPTTLLLLGLSAGGVVLLFGGVVIVWLLMAN